MNKKMLFGIIGALLILIVCAIVITGEVRAGKTSDAGINLTTEGANVNTKENTLRVTGQGTVSIKPDVAYLNVGVRTIDKDARKAQDDNKATMTKVLAKLSSLKIEDKDIQTTSYNIWPRYNYNGNREYLEGYEVENMIMITVHEVESVGDILDAVSQEGANRSYGINFGVLDTDSIYKQALEEAMEDAKSKAQVMGKKSDLVILKPLAIYEGSAPSQGYYPDAMYESNKFSMDQGRADTAGVPIATGEFEINAYVTIVYQVK